MSYAAVAPPLACSFIDPQTGKRVAGVITKRTKEREPLWYTIRKRTGKKTGARPITYNATTCQVRILAPPNAAEGLKYGKFVTPPTCAEVPEFANIAIDEMRGCELFAGSGRVSSALEEHAGLRVTRVDFDTSAFDATQPSIAADIGELSAQQLRKLCAGVAIHLSPQCSTYSILATAHHKRKWENNFLGATPDAFIANGLLLRLFETLRARQLAHLSKMAIITIENPDATFHLTPIGKKMQAPLLDGGLGLTLLKFSFCAFGEPWRKKSVLLTNSPTLIERMGRTTHLCASNGRCQFGRFVHTPITARFRNGGVETEDVTPFPVKLCRFIAKCVHADLKNGRLTD